MRGARNVEGMNRAEATTVDESAKRPVNSAMAVELQVCRNDLHNTRIMAAESGRIAMNAVGQVIGKVDTHLQTLSLRMKYQW